MIVETTKRIKVNDDIIEVPANIGLDNDSIDCRFIIAGDKTAYSVDSIDEIGVLVNKIGYMYVDEDGPGHDCVIARYDLDLWIMVHDTEHVLVSYHISKEECIDELLNNTVDALKDESIMIIREAFVIHNIYNEKWKTMNCTTEHGAWFSN